MSKQIISRDKFLEHGVHYGHRTSSWNPAMKPFIAKSMKGIHLINIDKTSTSLENAYQIAKRITEKKGTFLFVGTGKQSSKTVRENAERVGAFYIDHRWLGGLLTNFRTIQNSVNKLRRLERLAKEEFKGYTKKEAILMQKELDKLEKALGGIKFMRRTPQAIFVASIRNEDIAIKEAKKMRIPVFGIADTNVDPFTVNFPIFANDDGNKSAALITTVIADGIAAAKNERQLAAYVADEKVSVMGINPESERKPMERKFQRRDNDSRRTEKPARREEAKPAPKVEEVKEAPKVVEVKEAPKVEEVKVETPVVETPVVEAPVVEAPVVNEEEDREKTRELILGKISEGTGIADIKLTELFGVGPKTASWLEAKGFDTVAKLAEADAANFTAEELAELNLIGFKGEDEKRERLTVFITEAKFIASKA